MKIYMHFCVYLQHTQAYNHLTHMTKEILHRTIFIQVKKLQEVMLALKLHLNCTYVKFFLIF